MNSVQQLAREQAFYARRKFPVPAPSSARDRRSKDPNAPLDLARPGRARNCHCPTLSHCCPRGSFSENRVSRAQARSDLPKLGASVAILVTVENLSVDPELPTSLANTIIGGGVLPNAPRSTSSKTLSPFQTVEFSSVTMRSRLSSVLHRMASIQSSA